LCFVIFALGGGAVSLAVLLPALKAMWAMFDDHREVPPNWCRESWIAKLKKLSISLEASGDAPNSAKLKRFVKELEDEEAEKS